LPQQALRTRAAARHRGAGSLEKAFVVAHFGQQQHRAQKGDDAREPGRLGGRIVHRDRADGYQQHDRRNGGERLRPTPWTRDRERQNHRQRQQSQK
jgi:hypothetical protein